jgi:hypothetical protein
MVCAAFGCGQGDRKLKGVQLFRFPKNAVLRRVWVIKIRREQFHPSDSSFLCANHFESSMFVPENENRTKNGKTRTRRQLKPNAFPTIFGFKKAKSSQNKISVHQQLSFINHDHSYTAVDVEMVDVCNAAVDVEIPPHPHTVGQDLVDPIPSTSSKSQQIFTDLEIDRNLVDFETIIEELDAVKCRNSTLEEQKSHLESLVSKVLSPDQIKAMGSKTGPAKWSDATLKKAVHLRLTSGRSGYELLRTMLPLPCQNTISSHVSCINFSPGILDDFIFLLSKKTAKMSTIEKQCVLLIDEMAIRPSLEYDVATQRMIGEPTIPPSTSSQGKGKGKGKGKGTEEVEKKVKPQFSVPLATHILAFLIAGTAVRYKMVTAYHHTNTSFDAKVVADIIKEIIIKLHNVGLMNRGVSMDMGPGNLAV